MRDLVLVVMSLVAWMMAYFVYNMQSEARQMEGEYISLDELFAYFRNSLVGSL